MAYANVVSLSNTIAKLLRDHDQDPSSLHEIQQIKFLHEKVTFLQTFLDDFPEKLANNLEARIRDAADEAEETIEHFMSDQIRAYYTKDKHSTAPSVEVRVRFDFQKLKLEKVTGKIDLISREAMEIKNSTRLTEDDVMDSNDFGDVMASSSSMNLAPSSKDSSMVGFDDDLMAIKSRLCGESTRLQFIPIVGMGGIGKTTLARNAFNDSLTVEYFHIRAWVTVSQHYSAHEILSRLWFSINAYNKEGKEQNESIQEKVYTSLKGKRYLLVMDDMWSTEAWDDVRMIFPDDYNGSRIMITSRLYDVAAYPDSSSLLHEMRFMDADQSWNLLKQKVFARDNCPPELESVGKTIAASCRGLPLAIVLIAGLLATGSRCRATWESIASNVNRVVNTTNDEQFTKILFLSYIHLPHHLRPCFLYFGGFPEDYEIRVSKLIKLWVAEGFLKPNESISPEEVAEEYLEDLVKRCLVLVTKRKSNGKIKSCSIHDLVRESCIRRAQEDMFLLNVKDSYVHVAFPNYIKNWHRVSLSHADRSCITDVYDSSIRTILDFHGDTKRPSGFLGNFRMLRVLDSSIRPSFPIEVFELFLLTYLALDYPLINIPAAISNLQHLQTLIIHPSRRHVSGKVILPTEIWKIPQLRHLISFSFTFHPSPYPKSATCALESLRTLSEVIDLVCAENFLRMVPNLKKLGISLVWNMKDYQLENLVLLHQLEVLKLKNHGNFRRKLNPIFPASLRKLVLGGKWGFSWKYFGEIVGSLPKLEVLKLRNYLCNEDAWKTSEGEFLQLKYLSIENSNLKQWITESSHFPRLKCLVILRCHHLLEIPDVVGEIPTLEQIKVDCCNTSVIESAKRIQKEREETWGDDALQLTSDNHEVNDFDLKIVLKLDFRSEYFKREALEPVCYLPGLTSVALDTLDKKLTVTGNITAVAVVTELMKYCNTEIVSVRPTAKKKILSGIELMKGLIQDHPFLVESDETRSIHLY